VSPESCISLSPSVVDCDIWHGQSPGELACERRRRPGKCADRARAISRNTLAVHCRVYLYTSRAEWQGTRRTCRAKVMAGSPCDARPLSMSTVLTHLSTFPHCVISSRGISQSTRYP